MPDSHTKTLFFCPYLSIDEDVMCLAIEGQPCHPSAFQQEEYCIKNNSRSCPFYGLAETIGIGAGYNLLRAGKS